MLKHGVQVRQMALKFNSQEFGLDRRVHLWVSCILGPVNLNISDFPLASGMTHTSDPGLPFVCA